MHALEMHGHGLWARGQESSNKSLKLIVYDKDP